MPCMIIMYHKSSTIAKAPCQACVHIANGTNIECSTHIPHLHRSRAPTQEFMPAWTRLVPSLTLTALYQTTAASSDCAAVAANPGGGYYHQLRRPRFFRRSSVVIVFVPRGSFRTSNATQRIAPLVGDAPGGINIERNNRLVNLGCI
jgi:hypothetical protein